MNTEASAGFARPRVLFVCAGNTCRSVLAEHIARKKFGKLFEPSSAGVRPGTADDAGNTIFTLKDLIGVDASGHVPRDVRAADVESVDLVIAMSKQVAAEVQRSFPELPPERLVRWQIQDPYGDNLADYRRCANKIYEKLRKLVLPEGNS